MYRPSHTAPATVRSPLAGGQVTNGFKSPMGKSVPLPRVLRLKAEDVARTGNKPFRSAKFTWVTEAGRKERWIVASCGSHSVVWNLKCVAPFSALTQGRQQCVVAAGVVNLSACLLHPFLEPRSPCMLATCAVCLSLNAG